jgi:hypothetical protein
MRHVLDTLLHLPLHTCPSPKPSSHPALPDTHCRCVPRGSCCSSTPLWGPMAPLCCWMPWTYCQRRTRGWRSCSSQQRSAANSRGRPLPCHLLLQVSVGLKGMQVLPCCGVDAMHAFYCCCLCCCHTPCNALHTSSCRSLVSCGHQLTLCCFVHACFARPPAVQLGCAGASGGLESTQEAPPPCHSSSSRQHGEQLRSRAARARDVLPYLQRCFVRDGHRWRT